MVIKIFKSIYNQVVMRKIILLFKVLMILMAPVTLYAQNRVVTGVVRDIGGVLPGASVIEKGLPSNGTLTDMNGAFKLTLRGTSNTIIVKYVGYVQQEVQAGSKPLNISLAPTSQGLDEVVVVGFGKKDRITNTGSVSAISASEIRTVPTANVQNSLQGRLPGFFSQQASGQPGRDASDFFIRGKSSLNPSGNQPLIIVDDIEYTYAQLQQINVNEIETISILKDASTTAIYGIKGANGVLVVTTRRGKSGSPKFNFRLESGLQSPTRKPKFLDSYNSAVLINEAYRNDGLTEPFSQTDLDLFQNGKDPYGHPDVDWYNKIFKNNTYQVNTNLDISGGTDKLKYFISGGGLVQNGLVRDFDDPRALVNTNYMFKRYNFRSNLDLKANKTLDLRLDITTRFSDLNEPRAQNAVGGIYDFKTQTPFSSSFLNPNGSYTYAGLFPQFTISQLPTLNARLATQGYNHVRGTDFNVLLNATQRLDALTKGLSLTARIAYASTDENSKQVLNFTIPTYRYNALNDSYAVNLRSDVSGYVYDPYFLTGGTRNNNNNVNLQVFATYDKTFGDHHVSSLLLFNQTSKTYYINLNDIYWDGSRTGVPEKFRGTSFKIGYDFKSRYLIDFNGAYNGTDRFAANKRFGFFPAVSVGYRISEEEFFKKLFPTFSLFKVRASYGLVGSDVTPGNRYIYAQTYNQTGAYSFGESHQSYNAIFEGALANPEVVWEKAKKLDIGLDLNLLRDKVSATLDYFHDIRYDQLFEPNNIPLLIGVSLPRANLARTQNQGFDGQVTYRDNIGKVQFNTSFVFSIAKNKVLFQSEAQPYANLRRTGQPIDQPFGYESLGFYTQQDISLLQQYWSNPTAYERPPVAVPVYALSPNQVQAGDLKYSDLNGDGIIDIFDQKAIGKPNLANTVLGLTLGANYKGFSVNILFQGSFNYSFAVIGSGIEPFVSQFQPIHQERWTPATAATAVFPRLTTNPGLVNSPGSYLSDFWLINARYIRLKTIDFGYQLPTDKLPFNLNNARIYFSAYNLFTWTNFRKYQQDPEVATNSAGDAYINSRVVNLGLQLGF